jgi:hypothetical protein
MTDARFPERWLNDRRVLRLSDAAFRLFVCGLAWSVANKTDGYLSDEDLALISGVNLDAAEALYDAELWWSHMHGAQITEFEDTQSSRDELDALAARRRNDRRRKAAERARKATSASRLPSASRDSSRDSHAERVRTGQARPGAKTEGQAPPWLPVEFSDARGAGDDAAGGNGHPPPPSQTRKRVHDGPNPHGSDVQNFSDRGTSRGQPADRNACEACPVCSMKQRLRTNGRLARHGPKFTPCRGSGLALTGATP